MHDAFLKSVFADRRMAEILIRRHAPEWATELDFSTLREESTGLVSKKTLQQRHPDMIWSADTVNGDRVLFLLEFQRTVDRLMALRTTWPTCSSAPIRVATAWSRGERTGETTHRTTISRRWSSDSPATSRRRRWPCSCRARGGLSRQAVTRVWPD